MKTAQQWRQVIEEGRGVGRDFEECLLADMEELEREIVSQRHELGRQDQWIFELRCKIENLGE